MQKIGFIGLGDMGIYMSKNLLKAGHMVKGFDVSQARLQQFAENGGVVCQSSAEVGRDIDVAIVMVVTGDQVRSVLFGEHGLMESMAKVTTVIVTATIGT